MQITYLNAIDAKLLRFVTAAAFPFGLGCVFLFASKEFLERMEKEQGWRIGRHPREVGLIAATVGGLVIAICFIVFVVKHIL